jgi:hypothetical protein
VPGRNSQFSQSAAISKALEAQSRAETVREHLRRIVESPAFKGSERSREFLVVIVEKALSGHFEELKERVLGVELFGRATSYDTGEDAVVRVTASDVRKRLLRYYSESEEKSDLRLEIPVGSYIPDFHWRDLEPAVEEPILQAEPSPVFEVAPPAPAVPSVRRISWKLISCTVAGFALGIVVSVISARFSGRGGTEEGLPWSALLQSGRRLQIILSDTEISKMQNFVGYSLSLPDYANHKYLPPDFQVPPDLSRMLQSFRGQSMGAADVSIALGIAKRAPKSQQVSILAARSVQLKDFRTDDNFVILGSPRSDPWVALFQGQLDFQFLYDVAAAREVITNLKPHKGELPIYRPSAKGWDTGEAFGIIAFLGNPNQSGHVLLLAGSSAEATEAAGRFVQNHDSIGNLLKVNGISPTGSPVSFQILLKVNTMAGSANAFEAVAFHRL